MILRHNTRMEHRPFPPRLPDSVSHQLVAPQVATSAVELAADSAAEVALVAVRDADVRLQQTLPREDLVALAAGQWS